MKPDSELREAEYATDKGEVVLRPHTYDGIREYDQMLPRWWLAIFFGCIAFFPGYWVLYYHFGWFHSDAEVVQQELAVIEEAKAKELAATLAKLDDNTLIGTWSTDDAVVKAGHATFEANCIACHGQNLSAKIDLGNGQSVALPGLPLNDGTWKYGSRPMDLFKLIHDGTPPSSTGHNGARMEAWGQKMAPAKIAELTAFLIRENPKDFPAGK